MFLKAARYNGYVQLLRSAGYIKRIAPARKWRSGAAGHCSMRHICPRGDAADDLAVARMLDHVERQLAGLEPTSQVAEILGCLGGGRRWAGCNTAVFVATPCAEMIGESHACCSCALASQLSVGTLIPLLQVVRQSQQRLLGKLAASEAAHISKKWRSIPAGNAVAKPAIDR